MKNFWYYGRGKGEKRYQIKALNTIIKEKLSDNNFLSKNTKCLEKCSLKEKKNSDSFCECFFICSLPKDKGIIQDKFKDAVPDCGHLFCSTFPAVNRNICIFIKIKILKNYVYQSTSTTIFHLQYVFQME